jgi:hypothetical protein
MKVSILKYITEVGSVRQGDPIAYVVSVFQNGNLYKSLGAYLYKYFYEVSYDKTRRIYKINKRRKTETY